VSRRLHASMVTAFFAAGPPRRHPATLGGGQPPPWPDRIPRPEPGDLVTVQYWLQPTLRPGDRRRLRTGAVSGIVTWVAWDLIGLPQAEGGWVCASPSWAGGDPYQGTGRWHVPEVTITRTGSRR
jgi:hypothetical protein